MKNFDTRKARFLRDDLPTRLGGIAANLARIKSVAKNASNEAVVFSLVRESKFFIEWTAAEATVETAAELRELQVQLARWQRLLVADWKSEEKRNQLSNWSGTWSQQVLERSGLLDQ